MRNDLLGPDWGWHTERKYLVGPGLLLLVDTLLHRSLFFSKNMYKKCVQDQDRLAFADIIIEDHASPDSAQEFADCWKSHVASCNEAGVSVDYGMRTVPHSMRKDTRPVSADMHRTMQAFEYLYNA